MRHRKYLFLFAALVLASTFIGFLWFWAKSPIDCARLKGEQANACYQSILRAFVSRGDYTGGAEVCIKTKDPACYQAFGSLVPDPSLCTHLRRAGRGAELLCWYPR